MRDPRSVGATLLAWLLMACAQSGGEVPTPAAPSGVSVQDVEWVLVELNGEPIRPAGGGPVPTLTLAGADRRAAGQAGCNRLTGSYEATGDSLRFGALATTRMYCPAMDMEQQFLAALAATRSYRATANELELLNGEGRGIARFTRP